MIAFVVSGMRFFIAVIYCFLEYFYSLFHPRDDTNSNNGNLHNIIIVEPDDQKQVVMMANLINEIGSELLHKHKEIYMKILIEMANK